MLTCPNCGNEAQEDAIFCDRCGTRLRQPAPAEAPAPRASEPAPTAPVAAPDQEQGVICPTCGASNTPGEMFCSDCGTPLSGPQVDADTVASQEQEAPQPAGEVGLSCPDCGASISLEDEYCYACGAALRGRPSVAQPEASAEAPSGVDAPPPPVEATTLPAVSPEQVPAPAPEADRPQQPDAAPRTIECPACGAMVSADDTFCELCGAALKAPQQTVEAPAPPSTAQQPQAAPPALTPQQGHIGARLVLTDSGVELPIPTSGEVLVGREDPYSGVYPDIDLAPHGGEQAGVSRSHFKIAFSSGRYIIKDLNSTNFTLVNRRRLQPAAPTALSDGDEIMAGRLKLVFRVS